MISCRPPVSGRSSPSQRSGDDRSFDTKRDETVLANIRDCEIVARGLLDRPTFDYFAGGAEDEVALHANRRAWRRYALQPRVLSGVTAVDLSVDLPGASLQHPLLLAPIAYHGLVHPQGEVATAIGAAAAGALMTVSTSASRPMEDVRAATDGAMWFQLYSHVDRPTTIALIERAAAAGFGAIVLTVDLPASAPRDRETRSSFWGARSPRPANLGGGADRAEQLPLKWEDLEWIRRASALPVVLKGIVRADDAGRAVDCGASAVWVSNHGGRTVGRAQATALALSPVVAAVKGRIPVIVDGGIRRGSDVLVALALGATAVAIGRPQIWALAVGGSERVSTSINDLVDEFRAAMVIAGCGSLTDIPSDLLAP